MDVYSNYNAVMSGQNNGAYRYLVSSTPMGPIVGDEFQKVENSFAMIHSHEAMASFCAPRFPTNTEGMKLMEVSFSAGPYNHKIASSGNNFNDPYDKWEVKESFWVYNKPAKGLTQFFCLEK